MKPKHPEAAPSMRTKLSSPVSLAGQGGWAAQSMDFLTRKCKENLFFTFGSVTVKKQFQDPPGAESKTKYRRVWEHVGVPKSQHQNSTHRVV